jgi:uncharacterized protein (DUF1810 family)
LFILPYTTGKEAGTMTVKISVEADNPIEAIQMLRETYLLKDVEEAESYQRDEVKGLHESVSLIHEEIKRIHQRIENVIGTVNDLSLKHKPCEHKPLNLKATATPDSFPYPIIKLTSYDGYQNTEDKKAGKPVPNHGYEIDDKRVTVTICICKHCFQLYAVVETEEVPFKDLYGKNDTDPDLDSSCGP